MFSALQRQGKEHLIETVGKELRGMMSWIDEGGLAVATCRAAGRCSHCPGRPGTDARAQYPPRIGRGSIRPTSTGPVSPTGKTRIGQLFLSSSAAQGLRRLDR